jgi:hypothetical protein
MLVAIHQPEYLPWLGFFEKMLRADLFVLLDNVQYAHGDFQNRNRVKGSSGAQWLTVPVVHKFPQPLNEVEIAGADWQAKHWKTLASCYGRSAHFESFAANFESLYREPYSKLIDLNVAAIELLSTSFGLKKNWMFGSELDVSGTKSDLVLNICKAVGATSYYSGPAGRDYLNRESFERAGLEIEFQNFTHPTYPQLFMNGQGFVSKLSAVDLLFNCGSLGSDLLVASNSDAALRVAV